MVGQIATAGKKTIAVVDFTDLQGSVTELGRFFAEEFSVALAGAGKGFEVVDRTHLKSIIAEHKLSSTGIIDPQTARKLGKIAGVGALITGTITPFGDTIRLSVKVLDTETAKVIGASTGNIAKTKAIEELLAKGIEIGPQAATAGTALPKPAKPKEKRYVALQKVEESNFSFELKECRMSGTNVTCHLLITNNDQDRKLRIDGGRNFYAPLSRIFDDSGNEYKAIEARLGRKKGDQPTILLISGIPTRASICFGKVALKTNMITLLELGCEAGKDFRVQFRDIPLSK